MADEIIKEPWEVKDDTANECGCDVQALAARLRAKKYEEDQQVVDLRSIKQMAEQRFQANPNRTEIIGG